MGDYAILKDLPEMGLLFLFFVLIDLLVSLMELLFIEDVLLFIIVPALPATEPSSQAGALRVILFLVVRVDHLRRVSRLKGPELVGVVLFLALVQHNTSIGLGIFMSNVKNLFRFGKLVDVTWLSIVAEALVISLKEQGICE